MPHTFVITKRIIKLYITASNEPSKRTKLPLITFKLFDTYKKP